MLSREHKYHPSCLIALYRKAARIETVIQSLADHYQPPIDTASIAFAELSAYIEEVRSNSGELPAVFTLSKLSELYGQKIR